MEKEAHKQTLSASEIYESIIYALTGDYFDLYYVDVETEEYVEYGSRTERGQKLTERRGTNFFYECSKNAPGYVYKEDLERVAAALGKEKLLSEIRKHGTYIYNYRLLVDGAPTYVSMKATSAPGDDRHVIIGVSNVDTQVRDRMAAERAEEERKSYLCLSALNGNLVVLYFVNPKNGHYTEFSSSKGFGEFGISKQGVDFFQDTRNNALGVVHPEDQKLFHAQVTKKNVFATIQKDGVFSIDYRLVSDGLPTHVRLRAAMIEEDGEPMLIVGLLDEDAQVRQEQEYESNLSAARSMATVDSLTGIKNKRAYAQWEERINAKIKDGEQEPFAVVVCDVNDLKAVNDLYGHKEGDACIKKACARICKVFSHSPVFRIGGDEFAVILSGGDFGKRATLVEQVSAIPREHSKVRVGEVIAAGMADYQQGRHPSLLSVFEEADKAMYEKKQLLKVECQLEDQESDTDHMPAEMSVIAMRKRILVVDDVQMNRELLGELLQEDYDIAYASDGVEALSVLRDHKDEISLVLLDLYMPHMTGRKVMAEMQVDEELMTIPVIVLTVDEKAELDCLKIGAMDFISKPYPDIEIVKARIAKCIELSEDRDLIRHTECDKLTGLLNKDYFFRYASRLDHIHKEAPLDAVFCDVNRFHSANKQYGRQFCDYVLRCVGVGIRDLARKTGGICCRQGGDTFLLYCLHQDDYDRLIREFLSDVFAHKEIANKVSLRFGVFPNAQQEADIEERFARAKATADSIKGHPNKLYGWYA